MGVRKLLLLGVLVVLLGCKSSSLVAPPAVGASAHCKRGSCQTRITTTRSHSRTTKHKVRTVRSTTTSTTSSTVPRARTITVPGTTDVRVPTTIGCTEVVSPGESITNAESAARPGDVICLHGGTYREKVTFSHAGTASALITITSYPNETVTIDGTGLGLGRQDALLNVAGGANYLRIRGLRVVHSAGRGISNDGAHNEFLSNVVSDTQNSGIITTNWYADADHNLYDGNDVSFTVMSNVPCSTGGGWESAINHYNGGGHASGYNIWRNNSIHNNNGEGMTVEDHEIVTGNTVYDNYSVDVYLDGKTGAAVTGNRIYETETARPSCSRNLAIGIAFADEQSPHRLANNVVSNNTMTNTSTGINFWNAGVPGSGMIGETVESNVVDQSWDCGICFDGGAHSGTSVGHNRVTPRQGTTVMSGVQNIAGIAYAP
jgi:hypothetical protein